MHDLGFTIITAMEEIDVHIWFRRSCHVTPITPHEVGHFRNGRSMGQCHMCNGTYFGS